jgi:hypothetical protein
MNRAVNGTISGEELAPRFEALLLLFGAQRCDSRAARVENGSRRELQANEIIPILPGQNQVVLSAIETPAQ